MTPWYENKKLMHFIIISLIIIILSAFLYFDGREKKCHTENVSTAKAPAKTGKEKALSTATKKASAGRVREPVKTITKNPKKKQTKGMDTHPSKNTLQKQSESKDVLARKNTPMKSERVKDTKTGNAQVVSWSMKYRVVYRKLRNYGPCELCCPKWWRWRKTCYTQRKLMPGDKVMATDGSLPVGARIFIPALMETYTVEDKGTVNELFVYDKRDGLGIKRRYPYSHAAAREFGVQELELWILED